MPEIDLWLPPWQVWTVPELALYGSCKYTTKNNAFVSWILVNLGNKQSLSLSPKGTRLSSQILKNKYRMMVWVKIGTPNLNFASFSHSLELRTAFTFNSAFYHDHVTGTRVSEESLWHPKRGRVREGLHLVLNVWSVDQPQQDLLGACYTPWFQALFQTYWIRNLYFNKIPRGFVCMLKFEKHWHRELWLFILLVKTTLFSNLFWSLKWPWTC